MEQILYTPLTLAQLMKVLEPGIDASIKRAVSDILAAQSRQDELMGIKEAAKYLGFTPGSLYVLVSKRQVPHSKRGKRIYFVKSILDDWIRNGRRKTEQEIITASKR